MLHYKQVGKEYNRRYSNFIVSLSTEYYSAMVDYLYDNEVWSDFDSTSLVVFGYGYI